MNKTDVQPQNENSNNTKNVLYLSSRKIYIFLKASILKVNY